MSKPKKTASFDARRFVFLTANGIAAVAGLFVLILGTLLIATYVQLRSVDPLNTPALIELRNQFTRDSNNETLKQQIRALDLLARKAFFTAHSQIRTGSYLLIAGVLVLLVALKLIAEMRKALPHPESCSSLHNVWEMKARSRQLVAAGGLALLTFTLTRGFLAKTELESYIHATPLEMNAPASVSRPAPSLPVATQQPKEIRPAPPHTTRKERAAQWPGFRGHDGNATPKARTPPVGWDVGTGKNILWKAKIPRQGYSSPVVWGERVFLTGGDENVREVYAFSAKTGERLWTTPEKDVRGTPAEHPDVDDSTGWAAPTTTTDGHRLFAIFATGNLLCLNLHGAVLWTRHIGVPDNHYAHSSSLIMHEQLVIVQFDDNTNPRLIAVHAETGETAWTVDRDHISWSSPICVNTGSRHELILTDSAAVTSYEPATGKRLWSHECLGGEMGPSAACANGMVFVCNDMATAVGIMLTEKANGSIMSRVVWHWNEDLPDTASPLAVGKYVFFATSGGILTCVRASTGKTLWAQEFEKGFYASPVLIDDRIYLVDLSGVVHIFTPADTYEPIANLPLGEPVSATPAFVAGRIYFRGDDHLFCIGTL